MPNSKLNNKGKLISESTAKKKPGGLIRPALPGWSVILMLCVAAMLLIAPVTA